MNRVKWFLVVIFFVIIQSYTYAAERYHTFAGITAGWGTNRISYEGWVEMEQKELTIEGISIHTGALFCVFVSPFLGEWSVQYLVNSNEGEVDTSVRCLLLMLKAVYVYSIVSTLSITGGVGVYGEMPPSTLSYKGGAGAVATVGCVVSVGSNYRIFFDIAAQYGSFGLGSNSHKLSIGATISFVYHVGHI